MRISCCNVCIWIAPAPCKLQCWRQQKLKYPIMFCLFSWQFTLISQGRPYYIKQTLVYGPYFQSKGYLVLKVKITKKRGLWVGSEILHQKGVRFGDEILIKLCFVTNSDGNMWKISNFFWTNLFLFLFCFYQKKNKKYGVIRLQICYFWLKKQNKTKKKTWVFGWQSKILRVFWVRSELKRGSWEP